MHTNHSTQRHQTDQSLRRITIMTLLLMAALIRPAPSVSRALAQAVPSPQISLQPDRGPAGTAVSVSGFGYGRSNKGREVDLFWDGAQVASTTLAFCPGAAGYTGFGEACDGSAVIITVPDGAAGGAHTVQAALKSFTENVNASATFTV